MKNGPLKVIYGVLAFILAAVLVYFLFFRPEKDWGDIAKCALLLVSYILTLTGKRKRRFSPNYRLYEEQYKELVSGVFQDDKRSYRKLMEGISCYNRDEYKRAHKIFEKLVKHCRCTKDYTAVYMFDSLCYMEERKYDRVIHCYESLLRYDAANSLAWRNLAMVSVMAGKESEAREAIVNASRYDALNPDVYEDGSVIYLRLGEEKTALEYALKAIELNPAASVAMKNASVIYRLWDDENEEKYREMYLANGGEQQDIEKTWAVITNI